MRLRRSVGILLQGMKHKKEPQKEKHTRASRTEYSAGGVVFRFDPDTMRIAFIMDSYKKWAFPKGRIKKGEDIVHAAIRESKEEMGLTRLRPIEKLGRIDIWFTDRFEHKGDLVHKYIDYVLLQAPSGAELKAPPKPKQGEIIHAVKWVPMQQALRVSSYKDVEPILKKVLAVLKRSYVSSTSR